MTRDFQQQWFPGGDAYDPVDAPGISVHDGGHVFANTAPFPLGDRKGLARGERQQWIFDSEGARSLDNGAAGFINEFRGTNPLTPERMDEIRRHIRKEDFASSDATPYKDIREKFWNREMERDPVGAMGRRSDPGKQPLRAIDWREKSLVEINSPRNLYDPPIGIYEASELARRGKEYYGQISSESRRLFGEPTLRDLKMTESIPFIDGRNMSVNPAALRIHRNPDKIQIRGGYDLPGALPFGDIMQFVEKPKHPAIDMGLYLDKASKEIKKKVIAKQGGWNAVISNPPLGRRQIAELEADLLKHGDHVADAYGFGPGGGPLVANMRDFGFQVDPAAMQLQGLKQWRQQASIGDKDTMLRLPRSSEAAEIGATLREVERVRGAVNQGFRAGATALGGLPLLDPEFHDAIDQRDGARAAAVTAKNLAISAGAEVAAGFGAGVLQRTAPRVAAQALSVLGAAAGSTNAVGMATLAPGSAPVPTQVGRYGGAPVYHRSQDDSYVGTDANGKPVHLGRAKLGGKDVFVPWGSAAGTKVGPAVVGKPWWDLSGRESSAQRVTREAFPEARSVPASTPNGVARLTKPTKRGTGMEGVMRQVPALGLLNPARVRDAARAWNPRRGEFGVSELLFGR